ncbi:unnamed protein product [Rotaria sp. Silwood1]|nr:unnamed protein product [Rotaria sp. Silwood1]CAF0839680.1 unnamed protein product [Rotaria sp. Silwood1]CAF0936944.1 unnamed protein product [Rotaria sp. Silwood1]CAF3400806.1 unnamed protein product [Rotaria sp. Silwood1]CAF3404139.1 unnamed protein product [Rotaria sp. Silwood1]
MAHLGYSVTETIYHKHGQIIKLVYDYEELHEETELDVSIEEPNLTQQNRRYEVTIMRDEYERMAQTHKLDEDTLPFDIFVRIARPIMMGTYVGNELQEVFNILDKDQLGAIDIDELYGFLPIGRSNITKETLLHYIGSDNIDTKQKLNFDEFTCMILRGIGRDIICGNI